MIIRRKTPAYGCISGKGLYLVNLAPGEDTDLGKACIEANMRILVLRGRWEK